MTRPLASRAAVVVLIGLTLLTWWLADTGASPWTLAVLALVKVTIIGAVFLELARAWPVWTAIFMAGVAGVLGGAAWLLTA